MFEATPKNRRFYKVFETLYRYWDGYHLNDIYFNEKHEINFSKSYKILNQFDINYIKKQQK
jgi:hypothetical protein